MQTFPLFSCKSSLLHRCLLALTLGFLPVLSLRADAPPASLRIADTGADLEGLPTFRLDWNAISNATYLVQSADTLAPGSPWQTLDALQFRDTAGRYELQ